MTLKFPISNLRWRAAFPLLGALFLLVPAAASQTPRESETVRIAYAEWFQEGDRQDIPWNVKVAESELMFLQRQRVNVRVKLSGKRLQQRSVRRDLHLLVKLADQSGRWLEGQGKSWAVMDQPLPKNTKLEISQALLVRPGEYTLGIILYDRVTGERSVTRRRVRVPQLDKDPLPDIEAALPAVEFLEPAEGPDNLFRPELLGRLKLPVATRHRVHVEVLANFSASEEYTGQRRVQFINQAILLPTLNVLSQIKLTNGTLGLTALDLDRRRILFEQADLRPLDWPRLKEALAALRTDVVDTRTLEARRARGAFFREILQQRLPSTPGAAPTQNQEPFRVFLIVGSGILFPHGSDLEPIQAPKECFCRVYYLQYRVAYANLWDDLIRIVRPLEPKRFHVFSPIEMRRALAVILADLGSLQVPAGAFRQTPQPCCGSRRRPSSTTVGARSERYRKNRARTEDCRTSAPEPPGLALPIPRRSGPPPPAATPSAAPAAQTPTASRHPQAPTRRAPP